MQVFSADWFKQHQTQILWFANTAIGRFFFRIHGDRSSVGHNEIIEMTPHAITWRDGECYSTEFRTHEKFAKRLYHGLWFLWAAMHFLDWLFIDRFRAIERLSFGFSTLTSFPDTGTGSTTVDGTAYHIYAPSSDTWANLIAAAGNSTYLDNDIYLFDVVAGSTSNQWGGLGRSIMTFDTSSLTAAANISAVVLSLFGKAKTISGGLVQAEWDADIYTSTPAANNNIANGDYAQLGSTSQTGSALSYASFSTSAYNDFTFNSTGRGNVSKTGISKFGTRSASRDVAGVAPTWSSTDIAYCLAHSADRIGTSNDPKLVVTYTLPSPIVLTETVTTIDSRTANKTTSKAFTEVSTTVQVFVKSAGKNLADVVTTVGSVSAVKATIVTLSTEVVTLVQAFIKAPGKALTQTVTIVETFTKIIGRSFAQTATFVDTITKQIITFYTKTFTENITTIDTFIKVLVKNFTERAIVTDVIAFATRLKGMLFGVNKDTNITLGKDAGPTRGVNKDTNIIIGKQLR